MAMNTGKIQGKHREFNLNLNVATLLWIKNLMQVKDKSVHIVGGYFLVCLFLVIDLYFEES